MGSGSLPTGIFGSDPDGASFYVAMEMCSCESCDVVRTIAFAKGEVIEVERSWCWRSFCLHVWLRISALLFVGDCLCVLFIILSNARPKTEPMSHTYHSEPEHMGRPA